MRKSILKNCHDIIIKAGTRLLTDEKRIEELVEGIAGLRDSGHRVLLVSSGAVGMGMKEMNQPKRPAALAEVQALAAIGQCGLMNIYSEKCRERGFKCAQLLLTKADLQNRKRYLNVNNCINALWDAGVLPIVNENDSVSVAEIKFGDNDTLAGMLAALTDADLTIILTTESGLRDRNPDGTLGERISTVKDLDAVRDLAGGTDNAELSIGGMKSKLTAAELVTKAGGCLIIADGREKNILRQIFSGEDAGTLFLPGNRVCSRKRWLKFFAKSAGKLFVDAGAEAALKKDGKSLLCAGMTGAEGSFKRGDCVEICGADGRNIGCGLVNFSSDECMKLCGVKSDHIAEILGHAADTELVHRDNMVLGK